MSIQKHDLPCWCGEGNSCCSVYLDPKPHLHCFKCGEQTWKEDIVEEFMSGISNLAALRNPDTESKGNNLKIDRTGLFPLRGMFDNSLQELRGITPETAERYGVETLFDNDGAAYAISFPGYDKDDNFIAQKVKTFLKKMKWLGEPAKARMFGMRVTPPGGKYLTITEGEEDCLAVYQMLKNLNPKYEPAVISVKDGASAADKDCKTNWEYINSFEQIILCFDGDEPGRKAAEKVAKLFPYKCKIVEFGEYREEKDEETGTTKHLWKDASDYLKEGRQRDFTNMWYSAHKQVPKGVLTFNNLWDDMTRADNHTQVPYPWEGLNKKLFAMRTGEMVVWKAPPKIGKTQIMREIGYHIRTTSPHNVGLIFLEDTRKSIGLGMCALHMNLPIQIPDVPYSMEELKAAHEFLAEEDRITIFDPSDERTVENIFNKITYFVKAHDCKFIILDHASMLAYQAESFDERKFLDKLFADLKAMTTALDINLQVVVHVNDDGKTRGSRAPVQLCNALVALHRDKLNKDPMKANTTEVIVEENRISGDSGLASLLFFDRDTGRMRELDPDMIMGAGERETQFDD